jgi:hypothetical protein
MSQVRTSVFLVLSSYCHTGLSFRTLEDPTVDWGFKSVPQAAAQDRQIPLNRCIYTLHPVTSMLICLPEGKCSEGPAL